MNMLRHRLSEDDERWISERLIHDVDDFLTGDSEADFVFDFSAYNTLSSRAPEICRSCVLTKVAHGVLTAALFLIVVGIVFQLRPKSPSRESVTITSPNAGASTSSDADVYRINDRLYAASVEKINSASNLILTEAIDPIVNLPEIFLSWQGTAIEEPALSNLEVSNHSDKEIDRYDVEKEDAFSAEQMDTRDFIRASWNVGSLVLALERFYDE